MHSQNPPALPQAPSERQIRKRFTWDSMRKKEPAVPSTNASTTNTANGLSRAQTSLANYNSSSGLVKEKISAYNLRWADLRFYLQKLFEHSNLDYTNKHEDDIRAAKDNFYVFLPRPLSETEMQEIEKLRVEGKEAENKIRPRDEFD